MTPFDDTKIKFVKSITGHFERSFSRLVRKRENHWNKCTRSEEEYFEGNNLS